MDITFYWCKFCQEYNCINCFKQKNEEVLDKESQGRGRVSQTHLYELVTNWLVVWALMCLVIGILHNNPYAYDGQDALIGGSIFFGVMLLAYIIIGAMMPTKGYLGNITHDQSIISYTAIMRSSPPIISMHGEAYHYVKRTVTRNGKRKTEPRRVTTNRATEAINFHGWVDTSEQFDESALALAKIVKCDFELSWATRDEHSSEKYQLIKKAFFQKHDRDKYFDYRESATIDGFQDKMLTI